MSSHHIVREKQEPALLILGLTDFSFELLGQLLEWSPTLIATPDTAVQLHNDQIKIDWLIANEQIAELQSNIKLVPPADQSYLDAALIQLTGQGYPAVNIITDTFNPADYLPYVPKIDLVIYRGNEKIYPVKSGFSKWKPAGDRIKILTPEIVLNYTGLTELSAGTFETESDGFFTLLFNQPYLFIAEDIE